MKKRLMIFAILMSVLASPLSAVAAENQDQTEVWKALATCLDSGDCASIRSLALLKPQVVMTVCAAKEATEEEVCQAAETQNNIRKRNCNRGIMFGANCP